MTLEEFRRDYKVQPIDAGGVSVDIVRTTKGDGVPIVMLPGAQGTCEVFYKPVAAWGRLRTVVAVGYPSWPESGRLANWLAAFCAELGFDQIDLVGTSFGGYVAQHFAALHPSLLRRLVIGNSFHDPSGFQSPERLAGAQRDAETQKQEALARLKAQPQSELRDLLLDLVPRQPAENLKARALGVQLAKPLAKPGIDPARVMLVASDNDPLIPAPVWQSMQDRYPGACTLVCSGGGHYPFVAASEAYVKGVGAFLSE